MLAIRAFPTNATWDLPPSAKKDIFYCDDKGRLSITAVAERSNGHELEGLINGGFDCEVLSWRMDVEEPTAASTISQALSKGHEVALRTTKLIAVAVLKGDIIIQLP